MNQRRRLIVAGGYLLGLVLLSWTLLGRLVPPFSSSGTWFYAGVAVLILSTALTEPFYATPASAMANAVGALFAAIAFSPTSGGTIGASRGDINLGKHVLLGYALVVVLVALVAMVTKDAEGRLGARSSALARTSRVLGSARVVFSIVFLGASYASYARDPGKVFSLFLAWVVIVVVRPLEFLAGSDWSWLKSDRGVAAGTIVALRHPGLAEAQLHTPDAVQPGDTFLVGHARALARVLDASPFAEGWWALLELTAETPSLGEAVFSNEQQSESTVLGPVEPGSELTDIRFRLPGGAPNVREGNLVSVPLRENKVLYQIVAAKVRSESLGNTVEHRFIEATARKIGAWYAEERRFTSVPWLPSPGAPVKLELVDAAEFDPDAVGVVPDSPYGIRVDPHYLVTHNAAILGILGIGKTYLSFELVRRIIATGCKVVVLDITGQYAPHFREIFPEWYEAQSAEAITTAIAATRDRETQHVHEGGNIREFRAAVNSDLKEFIESNNLLKICNPGAFDVTRQDSKLFSGRAALAPLTIVETTRVFAEELLGILSTEITDQPRVCLVLEEAHSLVPEWNSTTYEGDQRASNGTAKAVLQGRKYGLGVLIITQRTANVTKTILNQCNTVFALRIYDATGMDFLRNYIGPAYADVLSSLPDRMTVIFGRASSCPSPVIIRVNDHDMMISQYWNPLRGEIPRPTKESPGDWG